MSFLAQKIDEKNRMKESISQHRTGLPQQLLFLFEARPMPPYLEPPRRKKPLLPITGVSQYLEHLQSSGTGAGQGEDEGKGLAGCGQEPQVGDAVVPQKNFLNPEYALQVRIDQPTKLEAAVEAIQKKSDENAKQMAELVASWDPTKDPNVEGDPFKTLFVARLSYDVSERKLRREFEEFGPIKRIRLVHDKQTGKPKGYAFIEFEHKSDMKEAYKSADGRRIEGRRCLIDVERGRTVPGWQPRRLGGGKGGETRASKAPKDPRRQFVRLAVGKLLGGPDDVVPVPPNGESDRREDGEGYRDRSRERRDRDRSRDYRDRERYDELRSHSHRSHRGAYAKDRYRDRDDDMYDRGRRDYRDYRDRKRDRDDHYQNYEDNGGYDAPDVTPDEPEEGEYVEGDRDVKRLKE